ncbi:MAG: LPS-assembly protein LptD, partial [Tateyamaria sp.]
MDSARQLWRLWASVLVFVFYALSVSAQDVAPMGPAVLVADDIQITVDRRLIATGNVEAFQGQTRLTATAIAYDPDTGRLTVTGPISIDDGAGFRILADQAELSNDMQNGLLLGARLVLNEQLQLAAVQASRVNGRYTQLYKTVVTSCTICADDPRPPLWQIRAKRVVYDEQGQQIYFDHAQLRIRSVPVFYWPRLRVPDQKQTRVTGVLLPEIRSDSRLGTGFKLPYFIALN